MSLLRRFIKLSAAAAFIVLLVLLHKLNTDDPSQARFRARRHDQRFLDTSTRSPLDRNFSSPRLHDPMKAATYALSAGFRPGAPKSPSSKYSRVMVVPCLKDDDVSWIAKELPEIDGAIYVADDPKAPLHPPQNKGHEVMIYLTYIIDHYYNLPDIVIFMHAHRWTHHNLELLGHDSAQMVRRLNSDYVTHEGYVNMRCQWYPGCPEWLHPRDARETLAKQEQVVLAKCWQELFPSETLPEALGQPCCAQFALSRERIASIPLGRFVLFRDWILKTPLSDYVSGRIWEYLWQFVFSGNRVYCPSEEICHCRGFGICFGGNAGYQRYRELRHTKEEYEKELQDLQRRKLIVENSSTQDAGRHNSSGTEVIDPSRHSYLSDRIEALGREIEARQIEAVNEGGGPGKVTASYGRSAKTSNVTR